MNDFSGIEKSTYYQEALAEQVAVNTHKWFLSESAGKDVGLDYANWNWVMAGHRARWLAGYRSKIAQSQ